MQGMTGRVFIGLWILAAFGLSGCRTHYVREGIWVLSFRVYESTTREPYAIPKRLVNVKVDFDEAGEGDILEITPVQAEQEGEAKQGEGKEGEGKEGEGKEAGEGDDHLPAKDPNLQIRRPMYADVRVRREGEPAVIQIVNEADAYYTFSMWGQVNNSEEIVGTHLGARSRRLKKPIILEGWWGMKWLREK